MYIQLVSFLNKLYVTCRQYVL